MGAVSGVDQLCCYANAVPGAPHAAFEDSQHSQRLSDLGDVLLLASEREGGSAGNHLESRNLGEQVQDLFGQSVTEVLVLLVRAHVGEWQDGD